MRFLRSTLLILTLSLVWFVVVTPVSAATLTKSGCSQCVAGNQLTLSWSSTLTGTVSTKLFLKNTVTQTVYPIYRGSARTGSYTYLVGRNDLNGRVIPAGHYYPTITITAIVTGYDSKVEIAYGPTFDIVGSGSCSITQTVYPLAGKGGTVTPPAGTTFSVGQSKAITAMAKPSHIILSFFIDGVRQTSAEGKTNYTGSANCSTAKTINLSAYFAPAPPSTVTPTADAGSTFTPPTKKYIYYGGRLKFEAKAKPGYEIIGLYINERDNAETARGFQINPPQTTLSRTFVYRVAPQTIRVVTRLKEEKWYITSSAQPIEGGTIDPLGTKTLPVTTITKSYNIIHKLNWKIKEVKIDDVVQEISDYYAIFRNPYKDRRTIAVEFEPACEDITPEQTLADLRNNQQTYINLPDFRTWASNNQWLVNNQIYDNQVCYIATDPGGVYHGNLADFSSDLIFEKTTKMLSAKKPALIGLQLIGSLVQPPALWSGVHGLLATDISRTLLSVNPQRYSYKIEMIDSNDLARHSFNCEDKIRAGRRRIHCPPSSYSITGANIESIEVFIDDEMDRRNNLLLSLDSVRENPVEWLKNNYTMLPNFSLGSVGGVCLGWSEFNAKASILVKECPFKDTTTASPSQSPVTGVATQEGTTPVTNVATQEGTTPVTDVATQEGTTVTSPVTTPVPANLLTNNSFSSGLTGWIAQGLAQKSAVVTNGALVITNDGSNSPNYYLRRQYITVKPGVTYQFGGKITADLGAKVGTYNFCQIDLYRPGSFDTNDITLAQSGTKIFTRIKTIPGTLGSAPVTVHLRLLTGYALNGTCAYDDIFVREVPTTATLPGLNQLAGVWAIMRGLFDRITGAFAF